MNLIFRTVFGSHLYGTETPTSDFDFKGVYLPTAKEILLGRIRGSITSARAKAEGEKNYVGEEDSELYSLDKFLKLVSEGQTVSLDMLFSSESCWNYSSNEWKEIQKNRHKLLTKNSKAFIGYCRQQANKYGIKGSRVAAARDAMNFLDNLCGILGSNKKLGDYAGKVESFATGREFVNIIDIPLPNGVIIRHLEVCNRKLPYTASVGNAHGVVKLLVDEYGTRALQAEKNEGVDWKALSHAVRIGEEAVELFKSGNIVFPRPNALWLKYIKAGKIPYQNVAETIENLFLEVEEASKKSLLPDSVDQEWIEEFIMDTYSKVINER